MKLKYIYAALIAAFTLNSCENFLDTENYTQKTTSNFPTTSDDIDMMLAGLYSTLNHQNRQHTVNIFYVANAASDDMFGGGGSADKAFQMTDKLLNVGVDAFESFWEETYKGIYRANMILEYVGNITDWTNDDAKNQSIGEAKFMRALLYFQMAQMFGEVPMPLTSEAQNLPKSTADELYAQITTDLKDCIETMPDKKYEADFSGHATKYVAEAYMARVFLFYTGYYGKETLPLVDGGSVTKEEVIEWITDCKENSGYDLVNDFRELWPYTNPYTINDYSYTSGQSAIDNSKLEWETDVNKEILFAAKYSVYGTWDDASLSNMFPLFYGIRNQNYAKTFPFGQGWGCGTVNSVLYDDWKADEPNDPRRDASILDVNNDNENFTYSWDGNDQMEYTGYFQKKYMNINAKESDGSLVVYSYKMYGAQNNFQLGQTQDLVLMRYADVLLMHSELTETADGINRVRQRVGLSQIGYSLESLKKERRYELAFEGLRWFDLMRWGDVETQLERQIGVKIINAGKETTMQSFGGGITKRYQETGGFWPIPKAQMDLSDGVLVQNKGWGTTEAEFLGW
ncbi:RagB/SusD family nutrient uptake outer membrane protein [Bacteroides caecigallinarum]|uniref:RagB/SusD family nutrient uptake outer membrane protein n=1 Tax=Bacteroides caecigallinarum TaxID=1411144 RepID=UPI001956DEED|nr:RagB/SusD family nutrient uptake outer membrane protein [Bacteroides caecigallinarum]MBM6864765.1 RagB/SusD family nutrient uptake outer membrane protein [Bacteroides caecigallinarum]